MLAQSESLTKWKHLIRDLMTA